MAKNRKLINSIKKFVLSGEYYPPTGFYKCANGDIIQWGKASEEVIFPMAFPSKCEVAETICLSPAYCGIYRATLTGFKVKPSTLLTETWEGNLCDRPAINLRTYFVVGS